MKSNRADIASRGVMPRDIFNCPLWWQGLPWLVQDPSEWPNTLQDYPNPKKIQKFEGSTCQH